MTTFRMNYFKDVFNTCKTNNVISVYDIHITDMDKASK